MGRPSRYPEEFRREAVALALSTEESRASVARRLGVNETTLRNWVNDHLAEEARQADPLAVTASEFEELRRLRREVAELRTEREIVRKAAAYHRGRLGRPGGAPGPSGQLCAPDRA
jgi:transposase